MTHEQQQELATSDQRKDFPPADYERKFGKPEPASGKAPSAYRGERLPHKCSKCDGKGWLQYNPQMPFGDTSVAGPWRCDVCQNGIIYTVDSLWDEATEEVRK